MAQCPQKMEELKTVLEITDTSNAPRGPHPSSLGQKGSQNYPLLSAKFRDPALQISHYVAPYTLHPL